MKHIVLIFSLWLLIIPVVNSQISSGGVPITWQNNLQKSTLKIVLLPKIDIPQVDTINKSSLKGTFKFAELIDFYKNTEQCGEWTILDNGDRLWQIHLKSEGAYSLNIIFNRFLLPDNAELFIYSPDRSYKLGAFTSVNNKAYGSLAVAPIPGDEVIIEYYEPEGVDFKGELSIGTIGHDYLGIFGNKDGQYGASGSCNVDINCDDGADWQKEKRSVCRVVINGSTLCSGTLVNNTKNDQTPYFLTANHCVDNETLAQKTVFYFNYESPTCNGGDGSISQTLSGADLIATKNEDTGFLDFTLLKLSANVPTDYLPYFAGWDSRDIAPQQSTCIHHPSGDVKKISQDYDPAQTSNYDNYDPSSFWEIVSWDTGTTEGGSSGSPIFDQNHRIVGSLTGGYASCDNDGSDYFQKFSASYDKYSTDTNQLKYWLDPDNSGVEYIDGYDTYTEKEVGDLILIRHWSDGQNTLLYNALDGNGNKVGYLSGNNDYKDKAKAEFFSQTEFGGRNVITGANVAFGYATGDDNTDIAMQVLSYEGGLPGEVLGESIVKLSEVKANADKDYVHYTFEPPVIVSGSVYLSVVLPQNAGDTVAIVTVDTAQTNTAWELNYYDNWLPYTDDNSWGVSLSYLISMEIGNYTAIEERVEKQGIILYPNPATDEITLDLSMYNKKDISVIVYDIYGREVLVKENNNTNLLSLNITTLTSGMYVVVVNVGEETMTSRFVKQ